MAQLSDDCFATGEKLQRLAEALAEIRARLTGVTDAEEVALAASAGRVLAAELIAPIAVPRLDNSAVDGFAVHFADLDRERDTVLPIAGRAAAGHPFAGALARGQAVRIFTGATMPEGADTVLMQEDCRIEDGRVVIRPGIRLGANRRLAGEDVAAGATILRAGRRLLPADIGLAASVGLARLPVRKPLRVALFSTGDEVRDPGQPLPQGAIYDANRFTLAALLGRHGFAVSDLGILPDRRERLVEAIARAADTHDALISSGGVSTGEEDHVKAAVAALGRLDLWRLAIKPGRPVALGMVRGKPYLGLPGNPAAAFLTYLRFARPVLFCLAGAEPAEPFAFPVRAGFAYRKKAGRLEWVRARLEADGGGGWIARKHPQEGAGLLTSIVMTDGIVELDEDRTGVAEGDEVRFHPYSGFMA